jgi:pathogenesis-related protein 1
MNASIDRSPRRDYVANLDYSISASTDSVPSYSLTSASYDYRTPTRHNPGRHPYLAPTIYPGVPGHSAERDSSELQPVGVSLDHRLLALQNSVRASVGEEPLTWSPELADVAQEWANHLMATGAFQHHLGGPYGENLFEITGGVATPQDVVSAWADEVRDYNLQTNACSGDTDCGHYTQIVWSTTRAVGCAFASASSRQVWVCEYYPAGNVIGYRPF